MTVEIPRTAAWRETAPEEPGAPDGEAVLPLWLTEAEARAVLQMCAVTPLFQGEPLEETLLQKASELLLVFYRLADSELTR